jgi:hypothetical protein
MVFSRFVYFSCCPKALCRIRIRDNQSPFYRPPYCCAYVIVTIDVLYDVFHYCTYSIVQANCEYFIFCFPVAFYEVSLYLGISIGKE